MDQNILRAISVPVNSTISDGISESREPFHINLITGKKFLYLSFTNFLKTYQPHLILDGDADQNYQCGFTSVNSVATFLLIK